MIASTQGDRSSWRPDGLVLCCDDEGCVSAVLHSTFLSDWTVGCCLAALVTDDSRAKAQSFLEAVAADGAAFDWELNAFSDQEILLLHLWGIDLGDSLLLMVSTTTEGLHWVYARVLLMDGSQTAGLRRRLQAKGPYPGLRSSPDEELYQALSLANNQLMNLQRELAKANAELNAANRELQAALDKVRTLRGLLPICANCKKVRDDTGYWSEVEIYVRDHSEAEFSHSICPDCMRQLYPDFVDDEADLGDARHGA